MVVGSEPPKRGLRITRRGYLLGIVPIILFLAYGALVAMMTTNFSYSVQKYDPSWCPAGTWNNITKSGYITSTIWLAPTTNYTVLLIKSAYYCKVYTKNISGYYAPGIPSNARIIAGNVLIK